MATARSSSNGRRESYEEEELPLTPRSTSKRRSFGGTSSPHSSARRQRLALRVARSAAVLGLVVALVYWSSSRIVRLFHEAERLVDRDSPLHMFFFFAVTLPFHCGLPIPIVHQVWAVAIGCFFRWHAFPILVASLSVGVPLPFVLGRRLARAAGGGDSAAAESILRRCGGTSGLAYLAPLTLTLTPTLRSPSPRYGGTSGLAYLAPLRRAIATRPTRLSFLLMWAPLPTSFLPLLVGFLIPPSELSLRAFVSGALPSKLLHFGYALGPRLLPAPMPVPVPRTLTARHAFPRQVRRRRRHRGGLARGGARRARRPTGRRRAAGESAARARRGDRRDGADGGVHVRDGLDDGPEPARDEGQGAQQGARPRAREGQC